MSETRFKVCLVTPHGTVNSGVRLLAAALRRAGFACDVIFFGRWINNGVRTPKAAHIERLVDQIVACGPDLVGLGFGSPYLAWARWTLAAIRERLDVPTVAGGIHPTLVPHDLHGHADYVLVGEGERALVELARALRDGLDTHAIPGLHISRGLTVTENAPGPLITDLDELPFRDFSDTGKFLVDGRRVIPGDPLRHARWLRVYASRGCPFACAYCYNASLRKVYGAQHRHRLHSVDWVLAEIAHLRRQLPKLRRILFDDDTFVFPDAWLEEFCRRYPKEVGLPFDILAHPAALGPVQLGRLQKAGLSGVQVGVQAASPAEAEALYHRTGTDKLLDFARTCRGLGLDAVYDVILDNPQTTDADREALLELLFSLPKPYRLFIYSLNFFPQTDVADSLAVPGWQVEGRSQHSLRQFRLTLGWPRPPKETLFAALISLASKPGVKPDWIRRAWRSERLRENPAPIIALAFGANWARLAAMGYSLWRRDELALYKIREYANPLRLLTQ